MINYDKKLSAFLFKKRTLWRKFFHFFLNKLFSVDIHSPSLIESSVIV